MIGFWEENLEDIKATFELMESLELASKRIHLVQPIPGSKIFEEYVKMGFIPKDFVDINFSTANIPTNYLSVEKLNNIYDAMVKYFYTNGEKPNFNT